MTDALVVGGGVIGLLTARELVRSGHKVTLLEKDRPGGGATWASAGIVSRYGTSGVADRGGEAGARLREASATLWPELAEAIRDESGLDPEYQESGVLLLARSESEASAIENDPGREKWGRTEWLSPDDLRKAEPALSPALPGALLLEGGSVDTRRLAQALEIACRRQGVGIRAGAMVREVIAEGGRFRGLRLQEETIEADLCVICAGTGSPAIAGAGPRLPIMPQKGQIFALDARAISLRHVLLTNNDPYFVPRADGRLIIGATREFAGEDPRHTVGGLSWLFTAGMEVLPAIEKLSIAEMWTGFRPFCADGLPAIGAGTPEGLFFCTGHGPSGIGPAPASVRLAAALICGTPPPFDPAPFDPKRFG